MKFVFTTSLIVLLFGCSSTNSEDSQNYNHLKVTNDSTELSSLNTLNRFAPRFPMQEAISGTQGCATVEYVVTKDMQVSNVRLVSATTNNFAKEAKKVVTKWDWQSLKSSSFASPIKLQTRFEYCLDDGNGSCAMRNLLVKAQCSGTDVIASIGRKVK